MEDYNKVIESLGVRYIKAKNLVLHQPFTVRNSYDVGNNLILLHKDTSISATKRLVVEEGEMLFIPGGRPTRRELRRRPEKPGHQQRRPHLANKDKFFHSNEDLDLIATMPKAQLREPSKPSVRLR
jgi:hypothetical protein